MASRRLSLQQQCSTHAPTCKVITHNIPYGCNYVYKGPESILAITRRLSLVRIFI